MRELSEEPECNWVIYFAPQGFHPLIDETAKAVKHCKDHLQGVINHDGRRRKREESPLKARPFWSLVLLSVISITNNNDEPQEELPLLACLANELTRKQVLPPKSRSHIISGVDLFVGLQVL